MWRTVPGAWVTVRRSGAPWVPSDTHNESPESCCCVGTVPKREAISLTARTDSLHPPLPLPPPAPPRQLQPIHPDMKRGSSTSLPTCLQVQRDPRLGDVRRVALGPDPPDGSAVYFLLRGRRHVRSSRAASTGDRRDCERFGAAAAATRAPARADGVGGGRAIVMVMEGRRRERGGAG